jgi:hypothetical protein
MMKPTKKTTPKPMPSMVENPTMKPAIGSKKG